jgi:hypothetical protein
MDQIELAAEILDLLLRPSPPGLPDQKVIPALYPAEEGTEILLMGGVEAKTGGGLKEDHLCLKHPGDLLGHLPGPQDLIGEPKRAIMIPSTRGDRKPHPAISGRGGIMGDELPGLQDELEAGRGLLSPGLRRPDERWMIEGLLNLHHREFLVITYPLQGKATGPDLEQRGHGLASSPPDHR